MALSHIGCLGGLEGRQVATTRLLLQGRQFWWQVEGVRVRFGVQGLRSGVIRIEGIAAFAVSAR